jgi:hypothetical protein
VARQKSDEKINKKIPVCLKAFKKRNLRNSGYSIVLAPGRQQGVEAVVGDGIGHVGLVVGVELQKQEQESML